MKNEKQREQFHDVPGALSPPSGPLCPQSFPVLLTPGWPAS